MTLLRRLDWWKDEGAISAEQRAQLAGVVREEPFSLFLELNVLLYLGVLAFVTGLGWTVATWSQQIGDLLVVGTLTAILVACSWYSFYRAPAWSAKEKSATSPVLDYVLYLGCLVWCIELAYLEKRFHLLTGQWDVYLLITAIFFLFAAYRFDNRFVLSLALSSLAGWLGVTISRWPSDRDATYREYALLYCLIVGAAGVVSRPGGLKRHFFGTYLNIVANVLFISLLSGVFKPLDYVGWVFALVVAVGASLTWGITQRQFVFVAYAAIYGYIGVSSLLVRYSSDEALVVLYFLTTGIAMLAMLVMIARSFGRAE